MGLAVFSRCVRHGFVWLPLLCGVATVTGCATNAETSASDTSTNIVTPSDESDVRRRARIRLELASNYFDSGQTAVALDEVKQALTTDPTYSDAYNLRGLIYLRLNDFPQAEDNFKRALALRVNDPNLLHNYGWLQCQQRRFAEADQSFNRALADRAYAARAKTLMAKGLCQSTAGQFTEAEQTLLKSYELDAGNPVVAYHIASLLLRRQELTRAQFYIRRLNNSDYANAESLWLGIKIEKALADTVAMRQLADQLRKRFPESRELASYQRGAFDE